MKLKTFAVDGVHGRQAVRRVGEHVVRVVDEHNAVVVGQLRTRADAVELDKSRRVLALVLTITGRLQYCSC